MIRKPEECLEEIRKEMRGGPGSVKIRNFVSKEELYGKGRLFSQTTLEPGCGIGVHEHNGEAEIFFIEEGEAVYNDNGAEVVVKPGDVTICRSGESHGIINKSDKVCKFIALIVFE